MSDLSKILIWPSTDWRAAGAGFAIGVFLLVASVVYERRRRKQERKMLRDGELRAVRDQLDEREVLGEDRNLLLAIIGQYSSEHPSRAVTKRHEFDRCMGHYFETLAATVEPEIIAQRGAQLRDVRSRLGLDYVPLGQRIYSTRELYDGQALWASPASGLEPRWFHLKNVKVDEAFFYVVPIGHDSAPEFKAGDLVKFRLWREDDARYLFEARIFHVERSPLTWRVSHAAGLTRNQARAHYRVRADLTVMVSILNALARDNREALVSSVPILQLYGRITSLSGGGMAVLFQQPMPKQMLMRVPISLPGQSHALVAYVRPTGSQNVGGGRSLVRGKFVAMDEETRDGITRYIFQKQKLGASDDSYSS